MIIENGKILPVKEIKDFVTNIDPADLKESYAERIRGFRLNKAGTIGKRDYGTEHRYKCYPIKPNAHLIIDTITNCADTGYTGHYQIKTTGAHGLHNGDVVYVLGTVSGLADGKWVVENAHSIGDSSTHYFVLKDSIYAATSGGIVGETPIKIVGHQALEHSATESYDIIAGLDSSNNLRFYVYDTEWIELTETIIGKVHTTSAGEVYCLIDTLTDSLTNTLVSCPADYLNGWVVYNSTKNNNGLIVDSEVLTAGTVKIYLSNEPITALGWVDGDSIVLYRSTGVWKQFDKTLTSPYEPYLKWMNVEEQTKTNVIYGDKNGVNNKDWIQIKKQEFLSKDTFLQSKWKYQYLSANADTAWKALAVKDANTAWVGGRYSISDTTSDGNIYKTADGGLTWTSVFNNPGTANHYYAIRDIRYYSDIMVATLVFVDDNEPRLNYYVVSSTDGTTWTVKGLYHSGTYWTGARAGTVAHDTNICVGIGTHDIYQITLSSFTSTIKHAATHDYCLRGIGLNSSGRELCVVVGEGGKIYLSENIGTTCTWVEVSSGTTNNLNAVSVISGEAWICGENNTILRVYSSGASWLVQRYFPGVDNLNSIFVSVDGYIFACGDDGIIIKSIDNGVTWTIEYSNESFDLYAIAPYSQDVVYTAGGKYFAGELRADSVFYNWGTVLKYTNTNTVTALANTWQIHRPQFITDCKQVGLSTAPLTDTDSRQSALISDGIKILSSVESTTNTAKYHNRVAVTVKYNGYEESDPIFLENFTVSGTTGFPILKLLIYLNLGKINKSITGFNIYEARLQLDGTVTSDTWLDDFSEYVLVKEIDFTTTPSYIDQDLEYPIWYEYRTPYKSDYDNFVNMGSISLLSAIGHAPNLNRAEFTPRYMVKAGRGQGSMIVADKDDRTLITTTYDGYGVHEDDNFVDISADSSANLQLIPLKGFGEIQGLAFHNSNMIVFRTNEFEAVDLISGSTKIFPSDCVAKDSIVLTPYGLSWAGGSGIYFLSKSGYSQQLLNKNWLNFYNGDLRVSGTSYVISADREDIVGGYDEFYHETIFQIRCRNEANDAYEYLQFRFNHDDNKWNIRKLNLDAVKSYSRKTDKTLSISTEKGIYKYPVTSGTYCYQDDVLLNAPYTQSKGIETSITINLGSLSGVTVKSILTSLGIDFVKSTVSDKFTVEIYNDRDVLVSTLKCYINGVGTLRTLDPKGHSKRWKIKIYLPTATLYNFTDFELNQIDVGYVESLGVASWI